MPIWNVSRKGGLGYLINTQRKLENDNRRYSRHNRNFKKRKYQDFGKGDNLKVTYVKQEGESSESKKIGLLETRLKDLDTKIAEEQNSDGKISLLLQYKILSQEYCMQLRESYGRLLSESVQNYQEALNIAEVFKNQASVFSGMFKTEPGSKKN